MSTTTRYSVKVEKGEILALTLGRMQLSGAMLFFFGKKNSVAKYYRKQKISWH